MRGHPDTDLPSRIDSPLGSLRGDGAEVKANLGSGIRRRLCRGSFEPLRLLTIVQASTAQQRPIGARSKDNAIGSSDQRLRGPR